MTEQDEDAPREGRPTSGLVLSRAECDALRELLSWVQQMDTADSYSGFLLVTWAQARPHRTLTALEQALQRKDPI